MIARVWRSFATGENVAAYMEHFNKSVYPELSQIAGYRGAYILQHELEGEIELTVMTLWESMEAIHKFAGNNAENAVVEPAAQAVLSRFDNTVTHYDVLLNP
jgi:heme-degrading monooxygenase HmoA